MKKLYRKGTVHPSPSPPPYHLRPPLLPPGRHPHPHSLPLPGGPRSPCLPHLMLLLQHHHHLLPQPPPEP
ncbi:hypothetical protein E2542_SST18370 [Spatholobus suberectus]|nr:hypothetical protein E2542_SST18370 [Spatholobus suberectus]